MEFRTPSRRTFLLVTGGALLVSPVAFANAGNLAPPYQTPYFQAQCPATTLQVGGTSFSVSATLPGSIVSFTIPERFVKNVAAFQCVSLTAQTYYQIVDPSVAGCALKTCATGPVDICGTSVPVPVSAHVGDEVTVTIATEPTPS